MAKLSGVFCPWWQNCLVSSVQSGKKVWCLLFTLAKNAWCLLGLVSFVWLVKRYSVLWITLKTLEKWCLLSRVAKLSGVFCPGWQNCLVSSVHGGKIVWCLLSRVAKRCGVFCSPWQKMPGVFWVWCLLSGSRLKVILTKNQYVRLRLKGDITSISEPCLICSS